MDTRNIILISILAFALCVPLCVPVISHAADKESTAAAKSQEDIWNRKKLTGDWGGLRTKLGEHGIKLDVRLSQYWQSVASGGVNTNSEYGGTVDYRVNIDAHKLGLWQGLAVSMHARTRFGEDVNADAGAFAIQNTGMMMPAPGDYHGTDVTGLTVSQTLPFFAGRLANVTVGKFDVVDTVTGFFPHLGYGQEGFWNVNGMITAMPWFGAVRGLALYGGIGMTINTEYMAPESGFVALGTVNESTSWGSVSDSFDDGVWLAAFHRFFWKLDDKMGYLMIFAGGSTRDQVSNDPHDFTIIPGQGIVSTEEKNPWDVAIYLYQDFWQVKNNPDRKATVLFGGTIGPDNPQFMEWHVFGSVEAFGPMAARPHDRMGVSAWYNGFSDNFTDLVEPVADLRDTWGVELYYNAEIIPSVYLSADLQLIENERKGDDLAVIPGLRMVIDF